MLLIFDCDGTLVDSELIALEILSEMMGALGRPMPVAACLDAFMGLHTTDIIAKMERLVGRPLPPDERPRFRERVLARMKAELKAVPGVADVLGQLHGPRCIASSSDASRIAMMLEWTGLAGFFAAHIFTAAQVARGKPAPDLFLFAARSMGFGPESAIVIEDSVAGVQAGVAAGMPVVGFAGGSHAAAGHAAQLTAAGADRVIAAMADLPDALAKLRPPACAGAERA